jgi:DMSO/TMAO reductase YedYZ molybdopterin-dependent catalytic subunit
VNIANKDWEGAKWGGVSMTAIMDLVKPKPKPEARWVVFYSLDDGHGGYNPDHEFFGYRQSI